MATTFNLLDKALGDYYVNCGVKDYYDNNGIGKFLLYVEDNEMEEEDMPDELGDDADPEDCSYTDMDPNFPLTNQQGDSAIFKVIQYCYKHNEPPNKPKNPINKTDPDLDLLTNYNINVKEEDLYRIEDLLLEQCADLRPEQSSNSSQDEATYSILQIGKQNRNQPLLMYLVDAFNRYRIQKRKKKLQTLKKTAYDAQHLYRMYNQQFQPPDPAEFIQKRCSGIKKKLLSEYKPHQQQSFIDKCQAAISVFPRRLLHKPPMKAFHTALIKDGIVPICRYIFQCYTFIENFVQQQNAPLPAQIDIVIIPKAYKMLNLADDKTGMESPRSSDDEPDLKSPEKPDNTPLNIGDINKRLLSQKKKLEMRDIEIAKANRRMLEAINLLFESKRCQRGILIIDRRCNFKKEKLYGFQPNVDKNNRCHCFESDQTKLLAEALIQNLRVCVLPKVDDEKKNINVNTQQPFGLTFSFHCFSSNEIRVYLCLNGWGGRFFLEDIKYFLPQFFVKEELDKLKHAFEKDKDRSFANEYGKCKEKCADVKFETFYKKLFSDNRHKSH